MAAPWTAAQAASDDVSKKMLIQYLQEKAGEDFVNENKIGGAITSVVKRVTKEQLVDMYKKHIGDDSPAPSKPAAPAFSFAPPAGAGGKGSTFSFSAAAPVAPADSGKPSPFTFNAAAQPPPSAPAPGSFQFNFAAQRGDADDDDDDEIDTSKMSQLREMTKTRSGGKAELPIELQKKLASMNMSSAERRDATIGELPADVRTRVESLEQLQDSVDALSKEFLEKLDQLKEEYEKKKAPLYKQRYETVTSKDGGVPGFWLKCLENNMICADEIHEHDEPILKHLIDIKYSAQLGQGKKGFQLAFLFSPNEYFQGTTITKTYLFDPDDEDECLTKAIGTEIDWKPGKNPTVKLVEKKQKKKGKVRTIKEEEPIDSFFQFFQPPSMPGEDEEMDEEEVRACSARTAVDLA